MLGWASSCNNLLPYLWLFPLARALDGESWNQRAWTSLRFFEHPAKLLPWGLLSFGSTWWKMSLIVEDRQGQAREKEHSKHSLRKRHSGVTEAAALVICCPDMKALLVALPFLESHFSVLPYKDSCAWDTGIFLLFLEHAQLTSTAGFLHSLCSSPRKALPSELVMLGPFWSFTSQFKGRMLGEATSDDLL